MRVALPYKEEAIEKGDVGIRSARLKRADGITRSDGQACSSI